MADFNEGFTPIRAIFYADFHPTSGPQVNCQVPRNAVRTSESSLNKKSLLDFSEIRDYMVPDEQLCNRLVSLKVGEYCAVGYPISIKDSCYKRNYFVFNFVFVFDYNKGSILYESDIRRLGKMFMALEEQSRYLSRLKSYETIESILQQVFQDINNYSECKIPIDESNTINIKLFPIFPPPPDIKPYDVPISTVNLESMTDANWDPTMEKIIPYMNGVNSIRQISELADAKYTLVKKCIQHLMHYGCVIIIDVFQFSNIYASTPYLINLLKNPEMMKECQSYIYTPYAPFHNRVTSHGSTSGSMQPVSASINSSPPSVSTSISSICHMPSRNHYASPVVIYSLYASFRQDMTVREWYNQNKKKMGYIDVRRFITFGVIKEIIYRVHEYPIIMELRKGPSNILVHDYGKKVNNRTNQANVSDPVGLGHELLESQGHSPQHHTSKDMLSRSAQANRMAGQTHGGSCFSSGTFISNTSSSRNSMNPIPINNLQHGHNSLPQTNHGSLGSNNSVGGANNKNAIDNPFPQITVSELITEIITEPRHLDALCTDLKMPRKQLEKILQDNATLVNVPSPKTKPFDIGKSGSKKQTMKR